MFSRRLVAIVCIAVLIVINTVFITISKRHQSTYMGANRVVLSLVAPFQQVFTRLLRFGGGIWEHYFHLVAVTQENDRLRQQLRLASQQQNQYNETRLANFRLRSLLGFKRAIAHQVLSAEVIGKDPSPWFKTVIIDKGKLDGLEKGLPVVVPEGIVGQITEVANQYAKVLLIIDQNNAVDGLVQRTRARGIIRGEASGRCVFEYALRKNDISVGDVIVSSGLDKVFPKGFAVGQVSGVVRRNAGIFQEVTVTPFVDFEKLEEVLVVLHSPGEITVPMP